MSYQQFAYFVQFVVISVISDNEQLFKRQRKKARNKVHVIGPILVFYVCS